MGPTDLGSVGNAAELRTNSREGVLWVLAPNLLHQHAKQSAKINSGKSEPRRSASSRPSTAATSCTSSSSRTRVAMLAATPVQELFADSRCFSLLALQEGERQRGQFPGRTCSLACMSALFGVEVSPRRLSQTFVCFLEVQRSGAETVLAGRCHILQETAELLGHPRWTLPLQNIDAAAIFLLFSVQHSGSLFPQFAKPPFRLICLR